MKKFFCLLIFLSFMFLINIVYGASDEIKPIMYEALVIKSSGADAYIEYGENYAGVVPYGSRIQVIEEIYKNNNWYGITNINDTIYNIELKDLVLENPVFDISIQNENISQLKSEKSLIVFANGVYLQKGPGAIYEKTNIEIPVGTIIKYKYILPNNWIYVDYQGQTGFINANQININENFNKDNMSKLAFVVENIDEAKVYVYSDTKNLYEYPFFNSNKIDVNIPKNTSLTYYYYIKDNEIDSNSFKGRYNFVYIEYNGIRGWLPVTKGIEGEVITAGFEENIKAMVIDKNNVALFAEYGNIESKLNNTITFGTEIIHLFSVINNNLNETTNWELIKYDDTYYWIQNSLYFLNNEDDYGDKDSKLAYESRKNKVNKVVYNNVSIYKAPYNTSEIINTIPKDTKFEAKYVTKDYLYVTHNGLSGWIEKKNVSNMLSLKKLLITSPSMILVYDEPDNTLKVKEYFNVDSKTIIEYDVAYVDGTINWYYISYENHIGWIEQPQFSAYEVDNKYKLKTNAAISIKEEPNDSSIILGTIATKDVDVASSWETYQNEKTWEYITYSNISGWIIFNDNLLESYAKVEKQENIEYNSTSEYEKIEQNVENENNYYENEEQNSNNNMPVVLIIICSIIVIGIVIAIILIVLNKKRRSVF